MIKLYPEGTDARYFQDNPIAAIDVLEALKAAVAYFSNPLHPARVQGQAAIDLIDLRHAPRRPMVERLARVAGELV